MRPRIRTVKPELFLHEGLADLEAVSKLPIRLVFIGLFLVADREGRFPWRPRTVKAVLFPYDDTQVGDAMEVLREHGFVQRYEVEGEQYGVIPNFLKHQVINHREADSVCPSPDAGNIESTGNSAPAHVTPGPAVGTPRMAPPVIGNSTPEGVSRIREANALKQSRDESMDAYIEVVFMYWRERMGKTGRTVRDTKRTNRLRERLLENDGDMAELLCTVDGALRDDWIMGRQAGSDGKAYNGIEVIFRDRAQVEKFAPESPHYGQPVHPFMKAKSE